MVANNFKITSSYVMITMSLMYVHPVGLLAPTNVKAAVLTYNSVEVTWDQSPDVSDYLISCTSPASYAGAKTVIKNGGDTTSHTLTNLVENTIYDITVQGLTRDGRKSDHSTKVTVITLKAGKWYICNIISEHVLLVVLYSS